MSAKKTLARMLMLGATCTVLSGTAAGCLSRPVVGQDPTTKVNFTSTISEKAVDKIDLLLAIDNSGSMADKQNFLSDAVPDLLTRLLTPVCVDTSGNPVVPPQNADITQPDGSQCTTGQPEFKPITDIHIGIVSSSLGSFGDQNVCPDQTQPAMNDHGHLVNRTNGADVATDAPTSVPDASPQGFLAWFPTTPAGTNAGKTPPSYPYVTVAATLTKDFQQMVTGDGQVGCGLEAQMESWYHFLVQPDPWNDIAINNNVASYDGVDDTILQQRHDFLRPDSLVAIILLSDEDDSFADPLSVGGQGWAFGVENFPNSTQSRSGGGGTTAPMGTSICAKSPGDPACTSCGFAAHCDATTAACQAIKNDPNCTTNGGYYAGDSDSLNVRFFHMKQRYGVDPQYPVSRYVNGLRTATVPFSTEEHNNAGLYQEGAGTCTNPLFASALPDNSADALTNAPTKDSNGNALTTAQRQKAGLCSLPRGSRGANLIFFANIGGVPNYLLHFDPTNPDASKLTANDYVKILGNNPVTFDYSGIDSHMWQAIGPNDGPRSGLPAPETNDDGTDSVYGREWDTQKNDLQYACTFPLPTADQKTCASKGAAGCYDCDGTRNPPLCQAQTGAGLLVQTRAKAYPTVRQFTVVQQLADQGIAASLCPLTTDNKGLTAAASLSATAFQAQTLEPITNSDGSDNPYYGYRPAVKTIVDRLKDALTVQCLPNQLTPDPTTTPPNQVPCLILATLGVAGNEAACAAAGLTIPDADILSKFQQEQIAAGATPASVNTSSVCVVPQIAVAAGVSCATNAAIGWCYVINSGTAQPAGKCEDAILFTAQTDAALKGATYSLQCIQQFGAGAAAGDDGGT